MTIQLINATKYYPTSLGPHYVFRNVNLLLSREINIGIIGPNGAGKSTLLRIIAGVDPLSAGRIKRDGKISWSMGLTGTLQPTLTGRENARFAARIYGMNSGQIKPQLERIKDLSGIGKYFELPAETYSAGMRQRVAFAISMSFDFDYYLFDEISAGGDMVFAKKAQAMMRERLEKSRFILASHNLGEIRSLCQAVLLVRDGTITYFDKVDDGLTAYGSPLEPARAAPKPGEIKSRAAAAPVAAAPAPAVAAAAPPPAAKAPEPKAAAPIPVKAAAPKAAEAAPAAAAALPATREEKIAKINADIAKHRQLESLQIANSLRETDPERKQTVLIRLGVTRRQIENAEKQLQMLETSVIPTDGRRASQKKSAKSTQSPQSQ